MKKSTLNTLGLFITVFTVSQFSDSDKANAAMPDMGALKNTPFSTDAHGCGCGCSSCGQKFEISLDVSVEKHI